MDTAKYTRRSANFAIAAASISIFIPRSARAAAIEMRQVHNQPVDSPLHRRLMQMWDAVAAETAGRVRQHATGAPGEGFS